MAKTGIHIKRANVGSIEAHNLRTKEYLDGLQKSGKNIYFFPEQQSKNQSWVNPKYAGKTCEEIFNELINLYKEKVGQKPQLKDRVRKNKKTGKEYTVAGWSPIREGVVPIKEDSTLYDFQLIINWAEKKGLNIIRIDIHNDEGYRNEKTNEIKYNRHAHIVFDWVDKETGKTIKLDEKDMSEFQDVVAESLQMERGTRKSETGLEHIDHIEYRERKAQENTIKLENKIEQQNDQLKEIISEAKIATEELKSVLDSIDTAKEREAEIAQNIEEQEKVIDELDTRAENALQKLENLLQKKSLTEDEMSELEQTISQLKTDKDRLLIEYEEKKQKLIKESYGALGSIAKRIIRKKESWEEEAIKNLEKIADEVKGDVENLSNKISEETKPIKIDYRQEEIISTLEKSELEEVVKIISITNSALNWNIKSQEYIDDLISGKSLFLPKGWKFLDGSVNDIDRLEISAQKTQDGQWSIFSFFLDAWHNLSDFIRGVKERAGERYRKMRNEEIAKTMNLANQSRNRSKGMRR